MSAQRVRTPGNNPETRIYCDWRNRQGDPCPGNYNPVSDWNAVEARRRAKRLGWVRVGGRDYCPEHRGSEAR